MNINILTDIELYRKIYLLKIAVKNHAKCKNLKNTLILVTARQNLYNFTKKYSMQTTEVAKS